ncbi:MAG TPA: class F sortase [Candidatus Paceibacterota bacterium]|nr:class F sortase [Candidatus Paceibacterota bacterium]
MKRPVLASEHRRTLGAIGIILLVVGVGIMLVSRAETDSYRFTAAALKSEMPRFDFGEPMPAAVPLRLRIPDLYIDTHFVPLGLEENGEIEIPEGYEEVGWYTYGPTPGEKGPAVVLGHVDSYKGPGVFLFLGQLTPDDLVYVDREDGTTATFRVTALERYDRDAFPSEKVYGDIDHAGLRLVTCSGEFDQQSQLYDRVLVVYAVLVEDAPTQ